jgi:hypothetical protein
VAVVSGPDLCQWGWFIPGRAGDPFIVIGAGDPPCANMAEAPSPYGWLCEEHVMELRLRLILLPSQIGADDDGP